MIFPSQVGEGLLFLGYFWVKDSIYLIFFGDLLESMRAKDIWSDAGRTLVSRISSDHTSQFDPISRYPAATQGHQAERFGYV